MAHHYGGGQISAVEKLDAMFMIGRSLLTSLARFVSSPFRGAPCAATAFHHAFYGLIKTHLLFATKPGNQSKCTWLYPYTDQVYLDYCSKSRIVPETSVTAEGIKGHWFGPRSAKKILVFFHGGGYVTPSSPAHIGYSSILQRRLESQGYELAVVILAYTLVPQGIFPVQLREAVSLLHHLMRVEGKDPSDIILCGDSAGGHLGLSILSHVLHPVPDVPNFDVHWQSYERNEHCDVLNPSIVQDAAAMWLGSHTPSPSNEPCRATSDWWSGLDKVVKSILIWGGGNEVFRDPIEDIGNKIGKVHNDATTMIVPGAGHEEMIFDVALGYGQREPAETVEAWLKAKM